MDPELEKILKDYRSRGASDAQIQKLYNDWTTAHQGGGAPAQDPTSAPVGMPGPHGSSGTFGDAAPGETPPAPLSVPEPAGKGFMRATAQHAMLNFGDEAGLIDPTKENAFEQNHKGLDFVANMLGGAAAPVIATYFAPTLASMEGAMALGGATGLVSGAGQQDPNDTSPHQMVSRSNNAAEQGMGGMLGGGAGHMIGSAGGKALSGFMDKLNPARVTARGAQRFIDPLLQERMNAMNKLAPGGASIANTAVPDAGLENVSKFKTAVSDVGASAPAAATSAADLKTQASILQTSLGQIGDKIQANEQIVPVTPQVRKALATARGLIGKYVPALDVAPEAPGANPLGLEQSNPFTFAPDAQAVTTTELHDVLSRLRSTLAQMEKRGIDAPGQMKNDYIQAVKQVKGVLYEAAPEIGVIDNNYARVADQIRNTEPLLEAAQRSDMKYGGAAMTGNTPATGGSGITMPTKHGVLTSMMNKLFVNKSKLADNVAKYITAPGGPDAVANLMKHLPASHPVAKAVTDAVSMRAGGTAAPKFINDMFQTQPEGY